jgi:C-terminal processing protease CtpA/Prc
MAASCCLAMPRWHNTLKRKTETMKMTSFKTALLGATAVLAFGALSAQASPPATKTAPASTPSIMFSSPAALPADLQAMMDKLPPAMQQKLRFAPRDELVQVLSTMKFFSTVDQTVSDPVLLQKNFNAKAHSLFDKLSQEEQAKAIPDIQQSVQRILSGKDVQEDFATTPPAEQSALLSDIISGAAYTRADAQDNYCNVMLDREGESAYNEEGVKKLAATPHQCPMGPTVTLKQTLEYVNKVLACSVGDPAYTRIMPPDEFSDMRQETAGTKSAFAGGGIGLNLSMDITKKLPPTAKELAQFADIVKQRKDMLEHPEADACTGLPSTLTAQEKTNLEKPLDPPFALGFTGLVYHVVKGGPADKAGLLDGDVVVKVDGLVVTGLESDDVVNNKLRGPLGSSVTVTVMRDGAEITKTMTRAAVLPDNVWSRDLGNGIYAIVITDFERNNTAFEVYDEVQKIGSKARGYVFDVRNNPGGILDEAIEAVSWFVHDGIILSQRERIPGDAAHPDYNRITWSRVGDHVIQTITDEATGKTESGLVTLEETDDQTHKVLRSFKEIPFLGDKPMVVLANDHSASAAEIFTGGMSENRVMAGEPSGDKPQGATFIGGTHTYGKFIGQVVMPGPLGTAIKATSFRYFSPKGEWLGDAWKTKIGLTASVKVEQPDTAVPYTANDAQLNASKDYLIGVLDGSKVKVQTP